MGRVVKNALLVVGVLLLFLLLIIPARAESESWTVWSSFDCNDWSGGCYGDLIAVPPSPSGTSIYVDASCSVAELIVERHAAPEGIDIQIAGRFFPSSSHTVARFELLALTPGDLALADGGVDGQRVYGVVIECYDPRPASFYGAPSAVPPADLATMTDAGGAVLASSTSTLLPMVIGLAMGMGIVVSIMRLLRWL